MKKKSPAEKPPKGATPRESVYRHEYAEKLIAHMAQGYSPGSFAGLVGVSRSAVYSWIDPSNPRHIPEFSEAYEIGCGARQLKHEQQGILGMYGELDGFSAPAWQFVMRNIARSEYHDAAQLQSTIGINAGSVNLSNVSTEDLHAFAVTAKQDPHK